MQRLVWARVEVTRRENEGARLRAAGSALELLELLGPHVAIAELTVLGLQVGVQQRNGDIASAELDAVNPLIGKAVPLPDSPRLSFVGEAWKLEPSTRKRASRRTKLKRPDVRNIASRS